MSGSGAKVIDTDAYSAQLRARAIDPAAGRLLITNFHGTEQEKDLSEPANCGGFGRVRHFRRATGDGWPSNPLPIDPACRALGIAPSDMLRTQAFQNAACNWRCWYCFVPFNLLSANPKHSDMLTPAELVDLYLGEPDPPSVIDLTGGQPDLVPEWVPWMMREIRRRGLEERVYLWSDDNLSNDYFWRHLSEEDRELIASYANYGRVCCFKGFDAESFGFNTFAEPALFDRQFELMGRLLSVGFDLYAYATFTTPSSEGVADSMRRFVDRLQALDENLPLRTVPLEVRVFSPVGHRLDDVKSSALKHQRVAVEAWLREIEDRFSSDMRRLNISEVPLRRGARRHE
jgi:uncharacterized Fe-S cluster-containing radical SAM superfamily protein